MLNCFFKQRYDFYIKERFNLWLKKKNGDNKEKMLSIKRKVFVLKKKIAWFLLDDA